MNWSDLQSVLTPLAPFVTGTATLIAASMALTAWRRNTLGSRQVDLAEKCLTQGWRLHDEIVKTRRLMPFLSYLPGFAGHNTPQSRKTLLENRDKASAALGTCLQIYTEFKVTYALTEMYLGPLAMVKSAGETTFFHHYAYRIPDEYEEIIGVLLVCLQKVLPGDDPDIEPTDEQLREQNRAGDLFFGFGADHIEDEITARLCNAKDALDRRMSFVLRRRRMIGRLIDKGLYALIKLNRRKVRISAEWLPRPEKRRGRKGPPSGQGCSTLWNEQDFKQVIDARQSGTVAVLGEGAGLV